MKPPMVHMSTQKVYIEENRFHIAHAGIRFDFLLVFFQLPDTLRSGRFLFIEKKNLFVSKEFEYHEEPVLVSLPVCT